MKKTLLLAVAMLIAGATTAQNQMATLDNNGTVTVYYGEMALHQAMHAAQDSAVITLSSGHFILDGNPQYISTTVTIRGNGFEEDTLAGTQPTIIDTRSSAYLHVWASGNTMVFEGIRFKANSVNGCAMRIHDKFILNKCYVEQLTLYRTNCAGSIIRDCIIDSMYCDYPGPGNDLVITNSVITYMTGEYGEMQVLNSIVGVDSNAVKHSATTFGDCVLMRRSNDVVPYPQTNCYRCIGIGFGSNFFADLPDYRTVSALTGADLATALTGADTSHYNYNFSAIANEQPYVLDAYRGEWYYPATDYHGLGITGGNYMQSLVHGGMLYQGMYPYNPNVNRPRFVRCDVAPVTTQDGKLSVNIQVVNTED